MHEQHDGSTRVAGAWLGSAWHERWLEAETDRLLEFGRGSRLADGGFARQGDDGTAQDGPLELWLTCRMTHVHSLGHLMGRPGCGALADHGVAAITTLFADAEHGGWFSQVGRDGVPRSTAKEAYPHAFVILASSSATAAGRPGADALLASALDVSERFFWDEEQGMAVEEWDRAFNALDGYRGVNANMHTVEAYLAAADVTGQRVWLDRAVRILERVVHGWAREWSWRLPEHFDATWTAVPDYNRDRPADPFRPFGATIGHWFEWARLTLHARAALTALGDEPAAWMLDDPQGLFDAGVREGWAVDGSPGFVYTVDFEGQPVVRERMHWVAAEAIGAAATLHHATGDPAYEHWYRTWWDYVDTEVIDRVGGSWWHELSPAGEVSRTTWDTKADLYHAVQATLIPRLPLTPSLATALRDLPRD
ncbi:hypothetical protein GCM10022415_17830 [Knoellia locipacati]|uniref:N-acyl-D-glucosamine 2-epimerase n=1 Tax=Knoellia locipacati TaxID=882824 RepID=A0A512T0L3_9MICO|nr:AGE family epimerase/isomerase [Knoellia locipacati]GEQ13731.1 hypothetical protein KLO01_17780 [Knoellia locipacati]